ncbi:MAG TPA: HlyD family efflux transporter periplasmic adaptor subunit [Blastocatellia bacterium]|nr:HlyD family efflux transporter periplasmic adaptor subunit [Blastocatellia bacterium]
MKLNQPRFKKLIALFVVAAAGFGVWWFLIRKPAGDQGVISLSGRIESDSASVAAKTGGRIREITVREGDSVTAGQVIAVIDDDQIAARERQEQSAVEQAEARLQQAEKEIAVLQAQLEQNRLGVSQAHADAQGRVSQAQAQVAAAEASLAQAQATYEQARYDKEKFTALASQGDVSERDGRQSMTAADAQKAVVLAAERQVEATRGALVAARATLDNPAIRAAQVAATEKQISQALSAVASAQADANRARARLQEVQADRRDLQIIAPFDGTVATRIAEPGEVVAPGSAIVTLVNFNQVYLRGFIPEGEIGHVRVGQPARVYLDSDSKRPLEAMVSRIDPKASFTPENTYFRDERVKQVVGVKLLLTDPRGFAKPGMPADGEVLVDGNEWVATTRR